MKSGKHITITAPSSNICPRKKMDEETKVGVIVDESGNVNIIGNKKGLLYLAKNIAIMGLIDRHDGYHIHLTVGSEGLTDIKFVGMAKELTITNTEFLKNNSDFWD
jgi:hypothetical protein